MLERPELRFGSQPTTQKCLSLRLNPRKSQSIQTTGPRMRLAKVAMLLVVAVVSGQASAEAPCTLKFSPNSTTIHEVQLAVRNHLGNSGGWEEEVGRVESTLK